MTGKFTWHVALLSAAVSIGVLCGGEAQAQATNTPPQIAPPANRGYWTKERMDNARPIELHPPPGYKPPRQGAPTSMEGNTAGAGEAPPGIDRPGTRGQR